MVIRSYMSIVTLNVNGLNALAERHVSADVLLVYAVYMRPTSDLRPHTD